MDKKLFDYFMEQSNERFDKLEVKVDRILGFRNQIIGGSVLLSLGFTIAVQFIIFSIQKT